MVLYVPVVICFLGIQIPLVASFQNIYLGERWWRKAVLLAALMVSFCMTLSFGAVSCHLVI